MNGTGPTPAELLALATDVAAEAGELARTRRLGAIDVASTKSTLTDVVTAVDTEVEALVRERIRAARPRDAILGEEGGQEGGSEGGSEGGRNTGGSATGSGVRWIVDPIDGTVNFLYDHPGYGISIAAELDGEIVAGVVAAPGQRETFTAELDAGARLNGRPIAVSHCRELSQALVGTGFAYVPEVRIEQARVVTDLIADIRDIRRVGVASLDLCWVACGRLDAVYERGLNLWDVAAGGLIAREAGAVVFGVDATGPDENGLCGAATPGIAGPLRARLADAVARFAPSWSAAATGSK